MVAPLVILSPSSIEQSPRYDLKYEYVFMIFETIQHVKSWYAVKLCYNIVLYPEFSQMKPCNSAVRVRFSDMSCDDVLYIHDITIFWMLTAYHVSVFESGNIV